MQQKQKNQKVERLYLEVVVKIFQQQTRYKQYGVFLIVSQKIIEIAHYFESLGYKQKVQAEGDFLQQEDSDLQQIQKIHLVTQFILNCIAYILVAIFAAISLSSKQKPNKSFVRFLRNYFIIHSHILSLPSLSSSIRFIYDSNSELYLILIALGNFILTIALSTCIEIFSYDYSFSNKNYIQKFSPKLSFIRFILSSFISIIYKSKQYSIFNDYLVILYSFDIVSIQLFQVYQKPFSCLVLSYTSGSLFSLMLFLKIKEAFNLDLNYIAGCFILITLGYHLGYLIFSSKIKRMQRYIINNNNLNEFKPEIVQYLLRILDSTLNDFYTHYLFQGKGINFENMKVNHQSQCKNEICFCSKIDSNADIKIEESFKQIERRQFIIQNFCEIINEYLNQPLNPHRVKETTNLIYSYLCFLSQVCNQPVKALYLMHYYRNYLTVKKTPYSYLIYFNIIESIIRKQIKKQEQTQRKIQLSLLDNIKFDEQIIVCKQRFQQYLRDITIYYDFLTTNFINLRELRDRSEILLKYRKQLIDNFTDLYKINPKNKLLLNLSTIYINTIDFEKRDIERFESVVKQIGQRGNRNLPNYQEFFENLETNACVVYSSLLTKNQDITKISSSFSQIFQIDKGKAIGSSINLIIPNIFQKAHQHSLQTFLTYGGLKMNESNQSNIINQYFFNAIFLNKETRFLFAQSGDGFIFPITLKLNLEFQEDDFGVCALITKTAEIDKEYILFTRDGSIKDISKNIFQTLFFKHNLIKSNLNKYNIFEMISELNKVFQKGEFDKKQNNVMQISKQSSKMGQSQDQACKKYSLTYKLKQIKLNSTTEEIYCLEVSNYQQINGNTQQGESKLLKQFQHPHFGLQLQNINECQKDQVIPNQLIEEQQLNIFSDRNSYLDNNQIISPRSFLFSNRNLLDSQINFNFKLNQNNISLVETPISKNQKIDPSSSKCIDLLHLDQKELDITSFKMKDSNQSQTQNMQSFLLKYQSTTHNEGNETFCPISPKSQVEKSISDTNDKKLSNQKQKTDTWSAHLDVELQSSASSVISSSELMQRQMIKFLRSTKLTKGLYLLLFIAALSFSIYLILTMVIYNIEDTKVQSFYTNFKIFDKPKYIILDIMNILTKTTIKRIYTLYLSKLPAHQQFLSTNLTQESYDRFNYNLNYLVSSTEFVGPPLESLLNSKQNITQTTILDQYWVQKKDTVQQLGLVGVICEYFSRLAFSLLDWQPLNENFMWQNFFDFNSSMKTLQTYVQQFVIDEFDSVIQLQQLSIGVCLGICLLCISFIFPLHFIIQISNESILKLLGTFKPEVLLNQNAIITKYIIEIDQQTASNNLQNTVKSVFSNKNQTQQLLKNQQNRRNRQIASFKEIQKLKPIFLLLTIIAISFLMLQPVVIYLFMKPFVQEQKQNLIEKEIVLDVYQTLLQNISPHLNIFQLSAFYGFKYNSSFYFPILEAAHEQNQKIKKNIQSLTDYMQIKRYKQTNFDEYYTSIINGNICETRENFPQFQLSDLFTKSLCKTMLKGVFQQGLIITTSYILDTLDQIYNIYMIYSGNDPKDLFYFKNGNPLLLEFQTKQHSFIEIYEAILFVSQIIEEIQLFQNSSTSEYIQLLNSVNIYLVVFQIMILIIVYQFGGIFIFQKYREQIQSSKQIFKLFHMSLLCTNDFILQYFKSQSRKQKR